MKMSRTVPKFYHQLVQLTKQLPYKCKWYAIEPTEVCELQYHGLHDWVTDDGYEFTSPEAALKYVQDRDAKEPKGIKPGVYDMEVARVLQDPETITIQLKNGSKIVINQI